MRDLTEWLAARLRPRGPDADLEPVTVSRFARGLLIVAVWAYVVFFTLWTVQNHDGFGTFGFDLGIYDQGLWLMSRFEEPFITIMGRHLFGDHTSFILLPLVPFYWVVPSAKVLLVSQALALGLAAVPAFLLGRQVLRHELPAALIAVAYLAHPAVGWTNFEQFHPDVFEIPLALFALYFMTRQRWAPFFLSVAGLLLVKEDVALLVVPLGIYVALRYHRRVGIATALAGLVYGVLAFEVILPALNGVGTLNTWRIPFGGPWGVIDTAVTNPTELIDYLRTDDRPFYVVQLLAPLALLPLVRPSVALLAALPLGSNLISTFFYQHHIRYHYTTLIVPVLVAATIFAVARFGSMRWRHGLAGAALGAALVSSWAWGPMPYSRDPAPVADPGAPSVPAIESAIEMIPDDAAVSAFYGWVTHVDHRVHIYEFPVPFRAQYWGTFEQEGERLPRADLVEYVIVPSVVSGANSRAAMDEVRERFELVYAVGDVRLYHRDPG